MNKNLIPFIENIEENTINNNLYRNVQYTSNFQQFVYMAIPPLDNIQMEVHEDHDQFIRIEKGFGKAIINDEEHELKDGIGVIIPAGSYHEIQNTSSTEYLKLYTIYSPPEHKDGTQQKENPDKNNNLDNSITNIPFFLVRHGESTNNVIDKKLKFDYDNNFYQNKEYISKLKNANYSSDPDLTKKGFNQASLLGIYLKNNLLLKNRKLIFYTSPFLRTLETTFAIIDSFNSNDYEVIVHPEIYENGGVTFINNDNKFDAPGKCLSSSEIKNKYGFNTDLLNNDNQWYTKEYEKKDLSIQRSKNIINFIKSKEFKEKNNNNIVFFIIHTHFMNLLLKEIMNNNDLNLNFEIPNTSTSLFVLKEDNKLNIKFINNIEHLTIQNYNNPLFNKI